MDILMTYWKSVWQETMEDLWPKTDRQDRPAGIPERHEALDPAASSITNPAPGKASRTLWMGSAP